MRQTRGKSCRQTGRMVKASSTNAAIILLMRDNVKYTKNARLTMQPVLHTTDMTFLIYLLYAVWHSTKPRYMVVEFFYASVINICHNR